MNHADINKLKIGNTCIQIADILNSTEEPKFRVNQRAVRDKFKLPESSLKKKMAEEEKASGINSTVVSDIEIAVYEVIEKNSCSHS